MPAPVHSLCVTPGPEPEPEQRHDESVSVSVSVPGPAPFPSPPQLEHPRGFQKITRRSPHVLDWHSLICAQKYPFETFKRPLLCLRRTSTFLPPYVYGLAVPRLVRKAAAPPRDEIQT
jgi:hypothetical protein